MIKPVRPFYRTGGASTFAKIGVKDFPSPITTFLLFDLSQAM